ncbi:plasmid mobilization relaxosome protein MobC [Paraflavitalea sp. CAU 1676]|uniref:plasmid mobilization protein n=1 Tax=Paraflavitalea sp. CAU 1676 TaxID=3032598 RepID=UPI0023DB0448|nr:plasmid mobilization relaxosome protein MobC [Paraflavitalea sp. CAU 1676]MDF2190550.1 plasmid mobilization relaxosome protein MobC [Paraflavitalea sp. CAU 1676]
MIAPLWAREARCIVVSNKAGKSKMGRRKAKNNEALKHKLFTRVNDSKFKEFQELLKKNPQNDMSSMLRSILYNTPVIVYTKDKTVDLLLEELAALRSEIKAIGVNINQMTRYFNTYPDQRQKEFYAKIGFSAFLRMENKMDQTVDLISKLGKKWLSE